MKREWVIVKWIEKRGEKQGIAVISPISNDGKEIAIGLSVITEIPNEKFHVVGELNNNDKVILFESNSS